VRVGSNLGDAVMIALVIILVLSLVCAGYLNYRIVCAADAERREMFRRGYYSGFIDSHLGRDRDWEGRLKEEEG
jgi:hypothetical protein